MCKVKSLDSGVKVYTFTGNQTTDALVLYYAKATALSPSALPSSVKLSSSVKLHRLRPHGQAVVKL